MQQALLILSGVIAVLLGGFLGWVLVRAWLLQRADHGKDGLSLPRSPGSEAGPPGA